MPQRGSGPCCRRHHGRRGSRFARTAPTGSSPNTPPRRVGRRSGLECQRGVPRADRERAASIGRTLQPRPSEVCSLNFAHRRTARASSVCPSRALKTSPAPAGSALVRRIAIRSARIGASGACAALTTSACAPSCERIFLSRCAPCRQLRLSPIPTSVMRSPLSVRLVADRRHRDEL